jgi:KUP system potassium uptake protein
VPECGFLESVPLTAAALDATEAHCSPQERLSTLAIGAIGVVFGDIGTSPLYALKESFIGAHQIGRAHV